MVHDKWVLIGVIRYFISGSATGIVERFHLVYVTYLNVMSRLRSSIEVAAVAIEVVAKSESNTTWAIRNSYRTNS